MPRLRLHIVGLSLLVIAGSTACGGISASQSGGSRNEQDTVAGEEAGARSGSYYYTADEGGGGISKIDAATNTFAKKIKVEGSVHNVQVSPDGQILGVTVTPEEGHDHAEEEEEGYEHGSEETKGSAHFYDTATDELVERVEVGEHPAHIVFTQDGRYVLVTNTEDDDVMVIDAKTYEILKTIPTGEGPHGFRISPDSRFAYVANMGEDTVSVLDLEQFEENKRIEVGETPVTTATTGDGETLFVTLNAEDALAVVDLATGTVEKTSVGVGPAQVYVQPDDEYAFVANQGNEQNPSNTLSKFEVSRKEVVETIETGEGAHGVVTSDDAAYVYVTNTFENTVSVIDNQTNEVVATVPVGNRPNGITFKP